MNPVTGFPLGPRPAGSAQPLAGALDAVLAGFGAIDLPESEESVRRLVRAMLEDSGTVHESAILAAAEQVLTAPAGAVQEAADRFAALVRCSAPQGDQLILLVEDDRLFARTLQAALAGPGRRIEVAETAAAARACLAKEPVAMVVLDLILPDSDGRNILVELRSDPRTAAIPLFVVSARLGTQTKAECFALGADAYFEKPLDAQAFTIAVSARLERPNEQRRAARRDLVTGLPNRAAFLETTREWRQTRGSDTACALAVLDLDHFRWIDETWGRQFADSVLRRAGVRLAMALRRATCFARWDGAEFIAFFGGCSAEDAGHLLEDALATLRAIDFRPAPEHPLTLTFSAGVVDVGVDQSIDQALIGADRLRHAAKAAGRGRVVSREAEVPAQRVIILDDDSNVRRLLIRHLRWEGFEVLAFSDGEEALAKFPGSGAALVISDVEMPRMDGLSFLERLRQHPEGRHIPVMMLTGMGEETAIVRAFELGADDYVLKPFSAREVLARVRRLLRRPSVMGEATQG